MTQEGVTEYSTWSSPWAVDTWTTLVRPGSVVQWKNLMCTMMRRSPRGSVSNNNNQVKTLCHLKSQTFEQLLHNEQLGCSKLKTMESK